MTVYTMPNPTVTIATAGGTITLNNDIGTYKFASLPSWHHAENKGKDFSFKVISTSSILNGGAYALASGQIATLSVDGDVYGYFYTDTVKPSADGTNIYVTCIDAVQRLAYRGQTIYRDYYDANLASYNASGSWNSTKGTIDFTVTAGSIEDPSDVSIGVNAVSDFTGNTFIEDVDLISAYGLTNYITCTIASPGFDMMYKISIRASCNTINTGQTLKAYAVVGGSLVYLGTSGLIPNSESNVDITFDSPYVFNYHVAIIRIYAYHISTVSATVVKFPVMISGGDNIMWIGASSPSENGSLTDAMLKCNAYGATYATVSAGTQSGQVYSISSITGVSSLSSDMVIPLWSNRIFYTSITSSTTISAVITGILNAVGVSSEQYSPPSSSILKFRSAGADTLTMLQTLCDMGSVDGTARGCFASSAINTIKIGTRLAIGTPQYNLVYPGDGLSLSNQIEILDGTPNLNMSTRKPICLTAGTKSISTADGTTTTVPIMVTMVDFTSLNAMGTCKLEQVSSGTSVSTEYAAAKESYGTVMDARGKDWSGTIVLSGFWPELISRANASYGSGVPVAIYNSNWGMNGYQARIKEITISWEDCTTTVELNNYSMRYANNIASAKDMAVVAAGYSVEGASGDAFSTQYALIYVTTAQVLSNTFNVVDIILTNGATAEATATVIKAPDLGGITVTATFLPEDLYDNTNAHSAVSVRINSNSYITIPEEIRPDKRRSQTLIINLVIPSSLITYT